MLTRWYRDAAYVVIDLSPDLQAYRTDRFEGWMRQPAEVGPVLFSQHVARPTSNLKPIEALVGQRRRARHAGDRGDRDRRCGSARSGSSFWLVRRKSVDERE